MSIGNLFTSHVKNGIPEIELPSFDPLILPSTNMSRSIYETKFQTVYSNLTIHNMHNYKLNNIDFNYAQMTLKGRVEFGILPIGSAYVVEGTFLGMPISGGGLFKGYMGPMDIDFNMSGRLLHRNGVRYCELTQMNLDTTIRDIQVQISGLEDSGFSKVE
ncbi:hypothetical protein RI129_004354 [Pyrocoelia pectoralis]|uniref:Uncharacterized protein n=1 Tax=Pyrocoelia pectoralis TaxID=417401 RepID=A0AAN7ZGQ6_9COLE